MTSGNNRPTISSLLDQAGRDRANLLDFLQNFPLRTESAGDDGAAAADGPQSLEYSMHNLGANFSSTENQNGGVMEQPDFEHMTKAVNAACALLKDLGKRNEDLTSSAEVAIASLRTQLAVERDRSNKLQKELDAAKAERERSISEAQSRARQLEAQNLSLTDKVEEAMRELESARPWIEYLNSQIHTELQAAISQAEQVISVPVSLVN